jgi:hypothetical protein
MQHFVCGSPAGRTGHSWGLQSPRSPRASEPYSTSSGAGTSPACRAIPQGEARLGRIVRDSPKVSTAVHPPAKQRQWGVSVAPVDDVIGPLTWNNQERTMGEGRRGLRVSPSPARGNALRHLTPVRAARSRSRDLPTLRSAEPRIGRAQGVMDTRTTGTAGRQRGGSPGNPPLARAFAKGPTHPSLIVATPGSPRPGRIRSGVVEWLLRRANDATNSPLAGVPASRSRVGAPRGLPFCTALG